MDDAALHLRIRVIAVSTRAAVRSMKPDDPQVPEVIQRGRALLDTLATGVLDGGGDGVKLAFERAREEVAALEGASDRSS